MQHHLLRTGSIILALMSGVSFAAAQQTQGGMPSSNSPQSSDSSQQTLALSPAQKQAIVQGLQGEQTQSSPEGERSQIGSKPPGAVSQQPLPNQVTSGVLQTKKLLFVKLPDRILLIDPDQQIVAEIIPIDDNGGQGEGSNKSNSNSGNQ